MCPTRPKPGIPAKTVLLKGLTRPDCYPHPVTKVRVMETHISWVMLTGTYAYKIKKPVDLGFADFTTLPLRRRYCEEELRLNRRLAPELYVAVVPIRGTPEGPLIGGRGRLIDYAVKMREFPQKALASRALARGHFDATETDALAAIIARFHAVAPSTPAGGALGSAKAILSSARQNFEQMLPLVSTSVDAKALRALRQWTGREHARCRNVFKARAAGGFVRECHGDLHLGNVVLLERRPVPFDCIEFNEALRWIDVMSEVSFVLMDLADRGRADLGWRFLNRYLEATGDYDGMKVLRFYLVYRALVRAKVHLMRAHQPGLAGAEKARLLRAFRGYLRLAQRFAAPGRGSLIITHGLSGCGKTTATESLIEELGAVRIRSDLERKRMHGVAPLAKSRSGLDAGIYTRSASAATYRRLSTLARSVLQTDWPVVVDATFLRRVERAVFRAIARKLNVPFVILDFRVPVAELRLRVAARHARADDASEADLAVLERQIAVREPLSLQELKRAVAIGATRRASGRTWRSAVRRLSRARA